MALPVAYTETALAEYLHGELNRAGFATDLGWSVAGDDYEEPVNDALALYGVDAIADVSGRDNIMRLRALARLALWQAVARATVHYRDAETPDGTSARLSQVHAQARALASAAEAEATQWGALPGYSIGVEVLRPSYDPDAPFGWT